MRGLFVAIVAIGLAGGTAGCSAARQKAPAPNPDAPGAVPPDLSSLSVMILPAQAPPPGSRVRAGLREPVPGLDAEIGFFLSEQAPRVHWVGSEAVIKAAANARSLGIDPQALSVSAFSTSLLRRIGDPLWGHMRLLGELTNARYALLPFAAGFVPDSTGVSGRIEIGAALIDTGNGNVLWTGYAAGDRGTQDSPNVIASAARALARKVAPK